LLFWKKLSQQLQEWGFEVNPHDWCVVNKTINGKQCTLLWHVDDLKTSHMDPEVVNVLEQINSVFGQDTPITVRRGKVHEHLGMTLDCRTEGKVKIFMKECMSEMLEAIPKDMGGDASTPAALHLFEVNDTNPQPLEEQRAILFHHYVAKALFLCKRVRPDIQTAVAFLSTRVKSPDKDDYKKLKRLMQHLRKTKDIELTLEADNLRVVKWWIDGSCAVYNDMRSHTGAVMSLGKGAVYGASTRQKLNTRSSTEAKLVGVDNLMGQVMWTWCFLQAQGYDVTDNIVYQDNKSAILLEKNGRASAGKRSQHINVRYFFVTDRIKKNELTVEHCPTKEMTGDCFTKLLQGASFYKMRNRIMNVQGDNNDDDGWHLVAKRPRHKATIQSDGPRPQLTVSGPQECVGD